MNTVSTLGMALRTRTMVSHAQADIARISGEVGSGFKHDVAASVGIRLGENISSRNMFDQLEEYNSNITLMGMRMEMMSDAYNGVEEVVNQFFGKLATAQGDSQMLSVMQQEASATIARVVQHLNVASGDRYLFSGVDASSPALQQADIVNPATGLSPMQAMEQMLATFPPVDGASATDLVALIDGAFDNDAAVPANLRFEGTFYKGTPALDAMGNPNYRVTGRIDSQNVLNYGAQANDQGFRDILKGLYMIASVDLTTMPKEAYDVYVAAAYQAVGVGTTAARQDLSVLAGYQNDLEVQKGVNENALRILNERLVGFETVDLVQANAKMTILETQLQASIILTNRMGSLSVASLMIR